MGLGAGIGALSGLILALTTAPDDCDLGCVGRPILYILGGTGVGLVGGLAFSIVFEREPREPASFSAGLRLHAF
jgi:hypothetical protein